LSDSALSITLPGPLLIKDGIDEDAADGILVVQVRRLGTVFRNVHEPAAQQALIAVGDENTREAVIARRSSIAGRVPKLQSGIRSGGMIPKSGHRSSERIMPKQNERWI
jgi:hypothetical protein